MNFGHGRPRVGGMTKRCVRHFSVYKKSMSVRTWMLDTLHAKTEGVGSWRFDFTEPFEIKEGQVVQVDDVMFQNVWPSISDTDRNVYVVYEYGNQASSRHAEILTLPVGVYSADEVASKLQTALNNGNRWNGSNSNFAVTAPDGVVTVTLNPVDTAPDISGRWAIYDGSSTPPTKLREEVVTKVSSTHYTFVESGANYTLDITAWNNAARTMNITQTAVSSGTATHFTWDTTHDRLMGHFTATSYRIERMVLAATIEWPYSNFSECDSIQPLLVSTRWSTAALADR